jgi:hypothetical protein
MKFLLILLILFPMQAWPIEEGILKLNQTVLPEMIVADRRGDGAVTIEEVIHDVKSFIHSSSDTRERNSFNTIGRPSHESTSNEESTVSTYLPCKPIWAMDLSESSMDYDDFIMFMDALLPDLDQLQILILSSVWLNDKSWDILLPILQRETFKYLNVCGTNYSTQKIKPILERGASLSPHSWFNLSLKLVFSHKSYLNRLKGDIKWVKSCADKGVLHESWCEAHNNYYKEPKIKQIEKAKALNLLTGDDEVDVDFEISDASFGDEDEVANGVNALSLGDGSW